MHEPMRYVRDGSRHASWLTALADRFSRSAPGDMRATGVRFSEVMTGTISPPGDSAVRLLGRNSPLALHLTVHMIDMREFLANQDHTAGSSGWLDCPALGGRLPVDLGTCSFFPRDEPELRYSLLFTDGAGQPLTLRGVKYLRTGAPGRVWSDTTTLHVRLLGGHQDVEGQEALAQGVLRLRPLAFAKQLTTFRSEGRSAGVRLRALARYITFFVGGLWNAYVATRRQAQPEAHARVESR